MPVSTVPATTPSGFGTDPSGYGLRLLNGFDIRRGGESIDLAPAAQRLVAFLAVRRRPCERQHVADVLFEGQEPDRASNSLRSTLHRIRRAAPDLLETSRHRVQISSSTSVDLRRLDEAIDRCLHPSGAPTTDLGELASVGSELLPGFYDDWVLVERERLRQRYLHALDQLARLAISRCRYSLAIEIALMATAMEPLRESSRRLLIQCHVQEGNLSEAIREYSVYAELLDRELGLRPTEQLMSLLPSTSR